MLTVWSAHRVIYMIQTWVNVKQQSSWNTLYCPLLTDCPALCGKIQPASYDGRFDPSGSQRQWEKQLGKVLSPSQCWEWLHQSLRGWSFFFYFFLFNLKVCLGLALCCFVCHIIFHTQAIGYGQKQVWMVSYHHWLTEGCRKKTTKPRNQQSGDAFEKEQLELYSLTVPPLHRTSSCSSYLLF